MSQLQDPIVLKFSYNASLNKVWSAITELDHMQKWYFDALESFEAKVGHKTSFIVMVEDRKYTHIWEVTEVIHLQKIKYNWLIAEYPGASYSMFELEQKAHQTELTVTSVVTEPFPENIPEFERESGVQGWTYLLDDSLRKYLENNPN